jgi:hypothetical protein
VVPNAEPVGAVKFRVAVFVPIDEADVMVGAASKVVTDTVELGAEVWVTVVTVGDVGDIFL